MPFKLKNFDIDKFNRDVNMSGGPDAQFERWANYREKISEFIDKSLMDTVREESVAVFGSGNLNDIDVRFMTEKFKRIVLSDADAKSVEEGLSRQGLSEEIKAKTDIRQADYSGVQKAGLFSGIERLAKRAAPAGEITDYIKETFAKMEQACRAPVNGERFDVVISCPVYTQLVYTQIEVLLKILYEYGIYEYGELNKMLNAAYNEMPRIIKKYNDLLLGTCNDGGYIILLTDVIEMEKSSAVYRKANALEKNGRIENREAYKLVKKHGIELAQTGLEDFASKTMMKKDIWLIWPFSKQKEYLVYGCFSKKNG